MSKRIEDTLPQEFHWLEEAQDAYIEKREEDDKRTTVLENAAALYVKLVNGDRNTEIDANYQNLKKRYNITDDEAAAEAARLGLLNGRG